MNPSTSDTCVDPTNSLLKDLEHRHNDVLAQLDELNLRVEQTLVDARRQFQPEAAAAGQ